MTRSASSTAAQDQDVDVAIVGYGPVGQALAALLGQAGHRVAVFERFGEIYRLPRAVQLDHEIMRLLQHLGVAGELAADLLPVRDYHWFGADGEPILTLHGPIPAVSGWEPDYDHANPIGVFVEPDRVAEAAADGAPFAEIHRRAMAGELSPAEPPVDIPTEG